MICTECGSFRIKKVKMSEQRQTMFEPHVSESVFRFLCQDCNRYGGMFYDPNGE